MRKLALSDDILLQIEKPARYIGGEVNSVMKDPSEVDIRFAMCFPDVYEIGMSISVFRSSTICLTGGRIPGVNGVYSPWTDLDKILHEKNIPLFALESQDPIRDLIFSALPFSLRCAIQIFCRSWI